jgi:hypothetical protein
MKDLAESLRLWDFSAAVGLALVSRNRGRKTTKSFL